LALQPTSQGRAGEGGSHGPRGPWRGRPDGSGEGSVGPARGGAAKGGRLPTVAIAARHHASPEVLQPTSASAFWGEVGTPCAGGVPPAPVHSPSATPLGLRWDPKRCRAAAAKAGARHEESRDANLVGGGHRQFTHRLHRCWPPVWRPVSARPCGSEAAAARTPWCYPRGGKAALRAQAGVVCAGPGRRTLKPPAVGVSCVAGGEAAGLGGRAVASGAGLAGCQQGAAPRDAPGTARPGRAGGTRSGRLVGPSGASRPGRGGGRASERSRSAPGPAALAGRGRPGGRAAALPTVGRVTLACRGSLAPLTYPAGAFRSRGPR
jgi:hypothetical protein